MTRLYDAAFDAEQALERLAHELEERAAVAATPVTAPQRRALQNVKRRWDATSPLLLRTIRERPGTVVEAGRP
jgi:hypothetical protein